MGVTNNLDGSNALNRKHGGRSSKSKAFASNTLVAPKKRRIITADKREELNKLFDKISDDPFYENDILMTTPSNNNDDNSDCGNDADNDKPVNTQDIDNQFFFRQDQDIEWLYENSCSEDDDMGITDKASTMTDGLTAIATGFLEQEQTEQLKQALDSTDHTQNDTTSYRFFSKRCKIPEPVLEDETHTMTDGLSKSRYCHVVNRSKTQTDRKFLLSSGALTLWHQRGWNCPHQIYQWLIETVGLSKDTLTAKEAMTTLTFLWTNLPNEPMPLHPPPTMNDINYNRNITSTTFIKILISYGAVELALTTSSSSFIRRNTNAITSGDDKIPLVQFQWVLQLFTKSLTLWPQAYSVSEQVALIEVFLYLGVDPLGVLLLDPIQDALEACLLALPDFKDHIQRLALEICNRFSKVEWQVRLTQVTKSTCPRSVYLRRVLSVTALTLEMLKDDVDLETTPDTPLLYLMDLLNQPTGIFQQTEPNYHTLVNCIYLLDYAIGTDLKELESSTETVNSLVTQLRAMGRKIGGRLGALDKTKASEAMQRLWSRLSYILDQRIPTIQDTDL